jgi:hypothetical protein
VPGGPRRRQCRIRPHSQSADDVLAGGERLLLGEEILIYGLGRASVRRDGRVATLWDGSPYGRVQGLRRSRCCRAEENLPGERPAPQEVMWGSVQDTGGLVLEQASELALRQVAPGVAVVL